MKTSKILLAEPLEWFNLISVSVPNPYSVSVHEKDRKLRFEVSQSRQKFSNEN